MARLEEKVTVEFLRESFDYDPDTGVLTWKKTRPVWHFESSSGYKTWHTKYSGKVAGCKVTLRRNLNYLMVKVGGVRTYSHRVAFVIYHGYFPEMIDHADGDGLNNRISNLLASNPQSNAKNQKLPHNSRSKLSGIKFLPSNEKWQVNSHVSVEGKNKAKSLGCYDTLFEAACVRISWMNANGYSSRHGT